MAGAKPPTSQEALIAHTARAYEMAKAKLRCGEPSTGPDAAGRAYLNQHGLNPLYGVVHGGGWTECMEGSGPGDASGRLVAGTQVMLDIGIFDQRFLDLPSERVGIRIEDTFCIDRQGATVRLSDVPYRVDDWVDQG